jgi:hypothetical protein
LTAANSAACLALAAQPKLTALQLRVFPTPDISQHKHNDRFVVDTAV